MVTVGIDEVGRGCWAGPLVAGAVILAAPIPGLKDSKQLSARQRERLAAQIQSEAIAVGLGWVTPLELDSGGITQAVKLAMGRALAAITEPFDELIVDGNINYFAGDERSRAVIKADSFYPSVSAASIVAKVARDEYMQAQDERYPGYGFARHVGYGTAQHRAALASLGVCELHRRSFKPIRELSA